MAGVAVPEIMKPDAVSLTGLGNSGRDAGWNEAVPGDTYFG
jgi:hypothetical protein